MSSAPLERVTTEYIPQEDRVRLSGLVDDGQTAVVWITHLLLRRLVPHIVSWLSGSAGAISHTESHVLAQEVAVARQVPQPRVDATKAREEWLTHKIDIQQTPSGVMRVVFSDAEGHSLHLDGNAELMRQWLGILYKTTLPGEWLTGVWPAWLIEKMTSTGRQLH